MDDVQSKKLLLQLEKKFAAKIWQRGKQYYAEGLVGNVVRTKNSIAAQSYGNSVYLLKIDLDSQCMDCSCPYDDACKHLAALLLWLRKNCPLHVSQEMQQLRCKTKEELLCIIENILLRDPGAFLYTQPLTDDALTSLIKDLWLPAYHEEGSFFGKLDYIRDSLREHFSLACLFVRKLLDMIDHDPNNYDLTTYLENFILDSQRHWSTQEKAEISALIEHSPLAL